ncbi:MAG: TolC family protein [Spirochaetales bacterium]|nr:TolC family protein [Spirochaetales bacterium]
MKRTLILIALVLLSSSLLFAGETYESLYKSMLHSNPALLKAHEETRKAELDVKDARGSRGPTIEMTAAATHIINNPLEKVHLSDVSSKASDSLSELLDGYDNYVGATGDNIGYLDYLKSQNMLSTDPLLYEMDSNLFMMQLNITQPLFTWGKLSNAEKIYKDVRTVRQLEESDAESKAVVELKTRLAAIYYLSRLIETLEREDEIASKLVDLSDQAFRNGMMIELDVKSARIDALEVRVGMSQAKAQLDDVLEGLRTMTGKPELSIEDIDFTPDESEYRRIAEADREALLESALSPSRTPLRMLSLLESVAQKKERIAEDGQYWKPDFALTASVNYGGQGLPVIDGDFFDSTHLFGTFSLGMKTTLWDGGKKLNEVARSKSDVALARLERSNAENTIRTALSSAFSTLDTALSQIDYLELKKEVDQSREKQKEMMLKHGSTSESELLKAQLEVNKHDVEKYKQYILLSQAVYTIEYLSDIQL